MGNDPHLANIRKASILQNETVMASGVDLGNPTFSIIVPTYNRMDTLPDVLNALEAQEGAPSFEVIVVNDGSTDTTKSFLQQRTFNVPVKLKHQENAGPAEARNVGVSLAKGHYVAFLGDDTQPSKNWLAIHYQAHQNNSAQQPCAVLGYTQWHRCMKLTPFLRYINEFGLQFGYSLINDSRDLPFNFFYTSNISLARELLLAEKFNTNFPYAAWEDTELSYRLKKKGMTIVYEKNATVEHNHPTDFHRFSSRQEKVGYSAVTFYRLHPELGPFLGVYPKGPPKLPSKILNNVFKATILAFQKLPLPLAPLWKRVLRYNYVKGLKRAWAEEQWS